MTSPFSHGGRVFCRLGAALALLIALLGGPGLLAPAPLAAAPITVANGNDSGAGSLRAAIAAAAPGDTIQFAGGVTTVTLTTAELGIAKNLTIQGSGLGGVTVQRSGAGSTPEFRIFHITGGATVTLRGLTIANGNFSDFHLGGGILNEASTLTVDACAVSGNAVPSGSGGGIANIAATGPARLTVTSSTLSGNSAFSGGGIESEASNGFATTLTITDSILSTNVAGDDGGAIENIGSHAASSATATVTNGVLSGNTAGEDGGAINNRAYGSATAALTVTNPTISGNTADEDGGGIANSAFGSGGATTTITGGIIANNTASTEDGGGIANQNHDVGSTSLTVTGSTISGNSARGSNQYTGGGGIANIATAGTATLKVTGSTLSGNTTSEDGGGIVNFASGDGAAASATVTDSTLSTNRADDDGGGIASRAAAGAALATLTVTGSTLNGNFADDDGGAIAVLTDDSGSGVAGPPSDSTLVRNSTLSGNNSDDESGAIDLLDATATLDYVTVAENSAAAGSHVARSFGDSTLTYGRSVFTLSASVPVFFFAEDAGGTFVSAGDNISQHDLPGVTGTDVVNTDPLLGPLAANGGPTATHLLLPGSAALNHIPLARCGAVATDQRGFSRPLPAGGACDSGAVEMTAPTILIAASATGVYGGTATLSATLTATVGGAPVNGRTVAFTLNGTAVGTAMTNGSGVATLVGASLGTIPVGSYPAGVGASFAGDSSFSPSHSTAGLTVTKASTATNAPDATAPYGDPAANPNATVTNTSPGSTATVNEGTVTFVVKRGAQTICTLTLPVVGGTASGNCPTGPLAVGTYAITASYSGGPNFLPSSDTATLTVARRVIWVKPTDRTVVLRQPNPPTTPPTGCATQPVGSGACWIELANGSTLAPGDDWTKLNLANLRFQYARNPPSTNSVEKVGSTYRITAFGLSSANYDVRYLPGTLTVVP